MRVRLQRLWVWEHDEAAFYASRIVGTSLHVCAGKSTIGDVKMDLYETAHIKADYRHIPIRNAAVDTVIIDPPWAKSERIDLGIRNWLMEICRVARNRIIIIHSTIFWLKWKDQPSWQLREAWAVRAKGLLYKAMAVYEPETPLLAFGGIPLES